MTCYKPLVFAPSSSTAGQGIIRPRLHKAHCYRRESRDGRLSRSNLISVDQPQIFFSFGLDPEVRYRVYALSQEAVNGQINDRGSCQTGTSVD